MCTPEIRRGICIAGSKRQFTIPKYGSPTLELYHVSREFYPSITYYSGLQFDRPFRIGYSPKIFCLHFDGIGARHPHLTLGACGPVGVPRCRAPMRSKCKQKIWGCILYETVYRIAIRCNTIAIPTQRGRPDWSVASLREKVGLPQESIVRLPVMLSLHSGRWYVEHTLLLFFVKLVRTVLTFRRRYLRETARFVPLSHLPEKVEWRGNVGIRSRWTQRV